MRRLIVVGIVTAIAVAAGVGHAGHRAARVIEDKAVKARGDGPDENVRTAAPTNDANKRAPAPMRKRVDRDRSDDRHCDIVIDNRTPWKIQIFVDGDFQAMLSPWGDATVLTVTGSTRLYAKAEFAEGPRDAWGPREVACDPLTALAWKLSE